MARPSLGLLGRFGYEDSPLSHPHHHVSPSPSFYSNNQLDSPPPHPRHYAMAFSSMTSLFALTPCLSVFTHKTCMHTYMLIPRHTLP